jgi:hypothetical protein
MKLAPWMKSKQKVCFLCAGKLGDDYGELEYGYMEEDGSAGRSREKICALCVARVEETPYARGELVDGKK